MLLNLLWLPKFQAKIDSKALATLSFLQTCKHKIFYFCPKNVVIFKENLQFESVLDF